MPGIEWARVEIFHLDEYIGLPKHDVRRRLADSGGAQLLSRRAGRTENVPQRVSSKWNSS